MNKLIILIKNGRVDRVIANGDGEVHLVDAHSDLPSPLLSRRLTPEVVTRAEIDSMIGARVTTTLDSKPLSPAL